MQFLIHTSGIWNAFPTHDLWLPYWPAQLPSHSISLRLTFFTDKLQKLSDINNSQWVFWPIEASMPHSKLEPFIKQEYSPVSRDLTNSRQSWKYWCLYKISFFFHVDNCCEIFQSAVWSKSKHIHMLLFTSWVLQTFFLALPNYDLFKSNLTLTSGS